MRRYSIGGSLWLSLLLAESGVCFQVTSIPPSAKHDFTAKDWSTLRSARAKAVSRDGLVLYSVTFGGDKGPTKTEWWTIAGDGTRAADLGTF